MWWGHEPPEWVTVAFWDALNPWFIPPSTCLRKAVEVASVLAGKRCSVVLQGGDTRMEDGKGWRGMEKDGRGWKRMEGDGKGWRGLQRRHSHHHLVPPEPSDRDLNCLLSSLVQLLGDPYARSLPGFQSLVQREWVAAGHPFPRRLGLLRRDTPREEVRAPIPVPPG